MGCVCSYKPKIEDEIQIILDKNDEDLKNSMIISPKKEKGISDEQIYNAKTNYNSNENNLDVKLDSLETRSPPTKRITIETIEPSMIDINSLNYQNHFYLTPDDNEKKEKIKEIKELKEISELKKKESKNDEVNKISMISEIPIIVNKLDFEEIKNDDQVAFDKKKEVENNKIQEKDDDPDIIKERSKTLGFKKSENKSKSNKYSFKINYTKDQHIKGDDCFYEKMDNEQKENHRRYSKRFASGKTSNSPLFEKSKFQAEVEHLFNKKMTEGGNIDEFLDDLQTSKNVALKVRDTVDSTGKVYSSKHLDKIAECKESLEKKNTIDSNKEE